MQHPDPAHIAPLSEREAARFAEARPRSAELLTRARLSMARGVPMGWMTAIYQHPPMFIAEGDGAWFSDVDGHRYLDMNVADLSMNGGFGPPAVVAAVAERMRRGSQFLLPTEDAIAVAEALARRYPLPCWQFTLSASGANAEIIRLARHATGREKILMFDGKYHGHIEDTLVIVQDGRVQPEMAGLPAEPARRAKMVDYNDLAAVERALAPRDVALVIAEPALTNVGVVLPEAGFHAGLRALTKAAGTLLAYDEAHTFVAGPAGLVGEWRLECDAVGLGKALGGGVPIGAYGVSAELARHLEAAPALPGAPAESVGGIATGGTLFGNALSMAAARATLEQVLTPAAYGLANALGARLADGIEAAYRAAGLDWRAQRLFCRAGFNYGPDLPRTAAAARAQARSDVHNLLRLYMANRGVWESVVTAGPTVSFAASGDDIEFYLRNFRAFVGELMGS
ncbi:MAG TPA: aminotransferase class III-fold pyridoxal phosphate-dependent enzyme [Candidatus Angelobacter sp.]|nr:aminotransferase class III-fold pyridoxal phosphate-dependent enzyme [Candidatus Angelobacter sp.]